MTDVDVHVSSVKTTGGRTSLVLEPEEPFEELDEVDELDELLDDGLDVGPDLGGEGRVTVNGDGVGEVVAATKKRVGLVLENDDDGFEFESGNEVKDVGMLKDLEVEGEDATQENGAGESRLEGATKMDKGKGKLVLEEHGFSFDNVEPEGGQGAAVAEVEKGGPERMDVDEQSDESLPSITQVMGRSTTDDHLHQNRDYGNLDTGFRPSSDRGNLRGTTHDGHWITFRRKPPKSAVRNHGGVGSSTSTGSSFSTHGLLEMPFHKMMAEIKSEAKLTAIAKSTPQLNGLVPHKHSREMWTDKYRPKKFTDLLGDERVHRQAMAWLKQWDSCAFPARGKAASVMKKERLKRKREEGSFNGKSGRQGDEDEVEYSDPFGRPKEKILLLAGPPGLGKTTLAHVLASQAGYQVLEINASDDRSAKVVQERIKDAVESRAITSTGSLTSTKPTCVVIDEIDGATGGDGGFIRSLIKFVQDGSNTTTYRNKGKGKKARPLLRPIICICNDLYAPALRPLRTLARIIRFSHPTNAMLVKRLRTICDVEQMLSDTKHLGMLVQVAGADLRTCLNSLQFIKSQTSTITESIIKSATIGSKDTGTSASAVWDRLFRIPNKKRTDRKVEDDGKYVNRLFRDVLTCGEYDKLAQGCFETYLGLRPPKETWKSINKALDWLDFYDRVDSRLRAERDYDLLPYVPYAFVAWHPLFASAANTVNEWPKTDYEMYLKRTAHQEVADASTKTLSMSLRDQFTRSSVVTEFLPFLMRIISPDLRPVNSQLIRTDEKHALAKVVNVMVSIGLTLVQDKSEDGQLTYKLEPPIDVFVHFEGKRASDIAPSRYTVRSIIAQQIEAETIKRSGGEEQGAKSKDILAAYSKDKKEHAKDPKDGPAVDFFGRLMAVPETADNDEPPPKKQLKVTYRYKEGFSNAVKVNLKVLDLLGIS